MLNHLRILCLVLVISLAMGCGETGGDEKTGIQMSVLLADGSEVTHIKYTVFEVDCPISSEEQATAEIPPAQPLLEKTKALKDMKFPTRTSTFYRNPFDEESVHRFADLFLTLPVGCYQVHVQPMADEETPLKKCVGGQVTTEVFAGKLTEEVLISQCKPDGPGRGVHDAITALNHRPEIKEVDVDPEIFDGCPKENETVTICVEAVDSDRDPMHFEWWRADPEGDPILSKGNGIAKGKPIPFEKTPGIASLTPLEEETFRAPGYLRQCVEVAFTQPVVLDAKYHGVVAVFDKLYDDGEPITFEQWYADRKMTVDGQPILSRHQAPFKIVIDDCKEGELLCNETRGYWKHLPNDRVVRQRWAPLDFEPFDEPHVKVLCPDDNADNDDNSERWIDILRYPGQLRGLYYRLARGYIAAKLNYVAWEWENTEIAALMAAAEEILNDENTCQEYGPGEREIEDRLIDVKIGEETLTIYISELQDRLDKFSEEECLLVYCGNKLSTSTDADYTPLMEDACPVVSDSDD